MRKDREMEITDMEREKAEVRAHNEAVIVRWTEGLSNGWLTAHLDQAGCPVLKRADGRPLEEDAQCDRPITGYIANDAVTPAFRKLDRRFTAVRRRLSEAIRRCAFLYDLDNETVGDGGAERRYLWGAFSL